LARDATAFTDRGIVLIFIAEAPGIIPDLKWLSASYTIIDLLNKHVSDAFVIRFVHNGEVTEVTLPFLRLFGQNVAFIRMLSLQLT
jgi:hypothetical protein